MNRFRDRRDAGRQLGRALAIYAGDPDAIVLALPRGGVPVGYEAAARIGVPLDVLVVRKLGVPGQEELAMGAVASGGVRVIDRAMVQRLGVSRHDLDAAIDAEVAELARREHAYRGDLPPLDLRGKIAIIVDDGLATGATMTAAVDAVRILAPARVIAAVPVAPPEACEALSRRADRVICLEMPRKMFAVGLWYEDFAQISDGEVRELLAAAHTSASPGGTEAEAWDH